MMEKPDEDGQIEWKRIAQAVEELTKTKGGALSQTQADCGGRPYRFRASFRPFPALN